MRLWRAGRWLAGALVAVVLFGGWSSEAVTAASAPPLSITTASLPAAVVGVAYSLTLSATGGAPPYSWSVASGAMPGGFLLTSAGVLEGLPSTSATTTLNVRVSDTTGASATRSIAFTIAAPPPPPEALVALGARGQLVALGLASVPAGAATTTDLPVGVAADPDGGGLWVATAHGHVLGLGVASLGSVGRHKLRGRIIAIAALSNALGYYLLSSTGHVYGFGAARGRGSYSGRRPCAITTTPGGHGYYVAGADGTVEAFGTATHYRGSSPARRFGRIVGIAALRTGGYVLVTRSGHVFRFGPARHVALPSPRPAGAVAVAAAPTGAGYFVVGANGDVYPAGTAHALGSLGAGQPLVAITATS